MGEKNVEANTKSQPWTEISTIAVHIGKSPAAEGRGGSCVLHNTDILFNKRLNLIISCSKQIAKEFNKPFG